VNVVDILNRVGEIIGSKENIAIAKALRVSPQSASNYKTRKAIPWEALYQFSRERNVSLEWLLTGEGNRQVTAVSPEPENEDTRITTVQSLLDLLESDRRYADAAGAAIELIRRIKDLEQQVKEIADMMPEPKRDKDVDLIS